MNTEGLGPYETWLEDLPDGAVEWATRGASAEVIAGTEPDRNAAANAARRALMDRVVDELSAVDATYGWWVGSYDSPRLRANKAGVTVTMTTHDPRKWTLIVELLPPTPALRGHQGTCFTRHGDSPVRVWSAALDQLPGLRAQDALKAYWLDLLAAESARLKAAMQSVDEALEVLHR